jgi:signal transduction histidine kinase
MSLEGFPKILTDGLALGVIVLDGDYRILRWNRWMEKHSGIKKREIIGQNILERYPDISERHKDRYITACLENKKPALLSPLIHHYLIPLNIVKAEKEIQMYQNVRIYPLPDENGVSKAVIIIHDLTEMILFEKEISRLTRLLKGIRDINKLIVAAGSEDELMSAACNILVTHMDYGFSWIGLLTEDISEIRSACCKGAGHDPACLKNKWGTAEYRQGIVGSAIRTGTVQKTQWALSSSKAEQKHNAENICCPFACSLPLKIDGQIIGALDIHSGQEEIFYGEEVNLLEEVASDISFALKTLRDSQKKRKAEEELRDSQEKMRLLKELEQCRRMESIGILAGGIAHDFNNLLTVILGNIQLAQMMKENTDKILSRAEASCVRAKNLTQQFLTLSQSKPVSLKICASGEFIREAANFALRYPNICCEFFIPDDLWSVPLDEPQMKHALSHLIANACDAMSKGGTVRIRAENFIAGTENSAPDFLFPKGRYLMISIQDEGVGIPEQDIHRVFDPYFSTKEMGTQKGMGLGLTITYSIIKKHGGYIRVTSEPNKGTAVCIYLPVSESLRIQNWDYS